MRYKPERALKLHYENIGYIRAINEVEMRYKPERALKQLIHLQGRPRLSIVEMRYKPERALKQFIA